MTRFIDVVAAIVFAVGSTELAHASAREGEFGAGAQSSAMAGTGLASVNTGAAAFINPSNLARCKSSSFEFGVRYISLHLDTNQSAGPAKRFFRSGDSLLAEVGGCALILDGLGIGVMAAANTLEPMTLGLTTPTSDIYVLRYSSAMSAPTLIAGVGYAFIPQVSLGFAIQVGLHTHITQDVFAPLSPTNRPFSTLIGATVSPRASFIAGLQVQPFDFFGVGATFRTANHGRLHVNAITQASALGLDIPPIHVDLSGIHDYSPRQFALGLTLKPFANLKINTDVNYAIWSNYPGLFLTVAADANSAVSSGIPLPPTEAMPLKDVFVPGVGSELQLGNFALRAGYRYHPSIVALPEKIQNLVDSDTHQFTVGGGFATHNEYIGVRVDAFFGTHYMPRRSVTKTENSALVAYDFGGFALSTGLNAAVEF